jgi:lysophospholipase L1-like esterase
MVTQNFPRFLLPVIVAAAICVTVFSAIETTSAGAGGPSPSITGSWSVTSVCAGSTCGDVILITIGGQPSDPDCSSGGYCVTSQSGFYGEGVALSPNGGGNWTWTCASCTGSEKISVEFKGDTFTGKATGIAPDGSVTGTVPYNGVRSGQPPTSLGVSVKLDSSTTNVGATVKATVKVTASNGEVSDITLGDGLTSTSGNASVSVLSAPSGVTLESGQSQSFTYEVKGVSPGAATLTVSVTGTGTSGSIVGNAQTKLTISALTFDYTMPERYSKAELTTAYAQPKSFSVAFTVEHGQCPMDATYTWFSDGNPLTTTSEKPCVYQADFAKLGTYSVRVEEHTKGSSGEGDSYTKKVVVQDLLVVSLGDSLASGEGSPPYSGPYDCDRSKLAYGSQAAKQLEGDDLRSSVTYLQLSCSGADIRPIALGSSFLDKMNRVGNFQNSDDTNIYAQLAELKDLVGSRPIDALTLSIGINNVAIQVAGFKIGFAKLVAICVADRRCQDQCVSGSDCSGLNKFIPPDMGGTDTPTTISDLMPDAIDGLTGLYDRLGEAINSLFPEGQLKPRNVYVVGYPNPLHDETGALCPVLVGNGSSAGFENLNGEGEVTWFESAFFKPLQRAEDRAASRFGWTFIDPDSSFATHGYCSTTSWFVHLGDLTSGKMNPSGIFHPTSVGQAVLASSLYDIMSQELLPGGEVRKPS